MFLLSAKHCGTFVGVSFIDVLSVKKTLDNPDRGAGGLLTLGNSGQNQAFPQEIPQTRVAPSCLSLNYSSDF